MASTHSQAAEPLTDEHRLITKKLADLCRADPALFSVVVTRSDALQAEGVDRWEASRYCLRLLNLLPEENG